MEQFSDMIEHISPMETNNVYVDRKNVWLCFQILVSLVKYIILHFKK